MNTKKNNKYKKNNNTRRRNKINDNFYLHINNKWIKTAKIKNHKKRIDEFSKLQTKVNNKVITIVENCINEDNKHNKNIKNIKQALLLDLDTKKILEDMIEKYNYYIKKDNLWDFLSWMNKNNVSVPFHCFVDTDIKNNKYITHFSDSGITLETKDYYLKKGEFTKIREEYKKYINNIFNHIFGDNNEYSTKDILKIETENSMLHYDEHNYRNPDFIYKKITLKELEKLNFNKEYLTNIGYNKIPNDYIVENYKYIKYIFNHLIKEWKTKNYKSYWIYNMILSLSQYNKEWRKYYFDFFNNYLQGIKKTTPLNIKLLKKVSLFMNTYLNKEYVKQFNNEQNINYCKMIIEKLKKIFIKRLQHNCWLSHESKLQSIKKLENLKFIIGYNKNYISDPNIKYIDNMYLNDKMYYNYLQNYYINKIGQLQDNNIWDIGSEINVFDVNAYYFPTKNHIYIPLAYIQKPFINIDMGLEYNIAYFAATIAHEITHAFDDEGSRYNYKGQYESWWTKKDINIFKLKQESVINQYENYGKKIGDKINGKLSLGENIADIGGLMIAEELLLEEYKEKEYTYLEIENKLRKFYSYYTQSWREKIRKQARNEILNSNEHLLSSYRANCSLARSEYFTKIYNITEKDDIYWYDKDAIW